MSERLSAKQIKHDIREDEVQSFLITAIERFQDNPSLYIGVIVGILALGVGITGGVALMDSRAAAGHESLATAMRYFEAPIVEADAKPDDAAQPSFATEEERRAKVEEALGQVSGSAADLAELYQARLALDSGDTEKARKIWEGFLRSNKNHALGVAVQLNLIELDRAEGKTQEVADRLQQQLDGTAKTLPEDVILFQLAKTRQALGETQDAKDLYQRILDDYPSSPYAADARLETTAG